ncbi:MAG: cupin domain-containing protein [Bacteroidetes bacterium]|jgi:quercetin dioxygenase-like cupin family protein|nr:cupin domain-containing protein [Bacteroidota bacterium]
MEPVQKKNLKNSVEYSPNSIVSQVIQKNKAGNITLFAFDKDEELSEHTAPFDALVMILEGKAAIKIDQKTHELVEGESILMPANIPHALLAKEKFKMMLIMLLNKEL